MPIRFLPVRTPETMSTIRTLEIKNASEKFKDDFAYIRLAVRTKKENKMIVDTFEKMGF